MGILALLSVLVGCTEETTTPEVFDAPRQEVVGLAQVTAIGPPIERAVIGCAPRGGTIAWANSFAGSPDETGAVVFDAAGRLYHAEALWRTTDFGRGEITSAGDADTALIAYDEQGAIRWEAHFGGPGREYPTDLEVAPDGTVLLAGTFADTVEIGGVELVARGELDVYLAAFDQDGELRWARGYGGTGSETLEALAIDASGRLHLGGSFHETTDLGLGEREAAGMADGFLLRLTPSGEPVWQHTFGGTEHDWIDDLVVDGDGEVYASVFFMSESADFLGEHLENAGSWSTMVARVSIEGELVWSLPLPASSTATVRSIDLAPDGDVVIFGDFGSEMTIGDTTLHAPYVNAFAARLGRDGELRWVEDFGGEGAVLGLDAVVASDGALHATGTFGVDTDFGEGALPHAGNADIFVATIDRDGALQRVTAYGGEGQDHGEHIAVSRGGRIALSGYVQGDVTLDAMHITGEGFRSFAATVGCSELRGPD